MTKKVTKQDCVGCEDDFYNHRTGFDGATECWNLKSATMKMRKRVHINDVPPWNHKPEKMPSCYRVKQYVFVDAKVSR